MGKKKTKLTAVTTKKFKKVENSQKLITNFHVLNKLLARATDKKEKQEIKKKLNALGGLNTYQKASLSAGNERKGLGSNGKCCCCGEKLLNYKKEKSRKIRVLDVGGLSGATFSKYAYAIDATYIDLNPQKSNVVKQDFFQRPTPETCFNNHNAEAYNIMETDYFDCISLSLVLNFVPTPELRGKMLQKCLEFLPKSGKGFIFIVLPAPCVRNSRYMSHEVLLKIMKLLHFDLKEYHYSLRLGFYLFQSMEFAEQHNSMERVEYKKHKIKDGVGLNNFCITL
ncbi:hypothetical protein HK099_002258 [Clydaea vesicula]|uniref:25S rRNA adenine-N(1) methyltransferase n=1 Tax=Clydaea vesicula TaxID=447962 RepID=A0AAD5TXS5_9FUNG|nr:hypothetical protein HK099_002258 [Clydaea vesicula]